MRSCLSASSWCSPILGTTSLPTTTDVMNSRLYSTACWLKRRRKMMQFQNAWQPSGTVSAATMLTLRNMRGRKKSSWFQGFTYSFRQGNILSMISYDVGRVRRGEREGKSFLLLLLFLLWRPSKLEHLSLSLSLSLSRAIGSIGRTDFQKDRSFHLFSIFFSQLTFSPSPSSSLPRILLDTFNSPVRNHARKKIPEYHASSSIPVYHARIRERSCFSLFLSLSLCEIFFFSCSLKSEKDKKNLTSEPLREYTFLGILSVYLFIHTSQ